MSLPGEYVESIERYGYTSTEARFLYLVATHSGYFTQQQFFRFAGVHRGGMGTRLTRKAIQHGHIRTARLARHTLIYNLFSRPFYESIDKDNLRNRRRLSDELIRTRLLILDFVLTHPDHDYLETEHDKVRYFHEELGLPLSLLPHRTYKGTQSHSETERYFVDRFSIFLSRSQSVSDHSVPSMSIAIAPVIPLSASCPTSKTISPCSAACLSSSWCMRLPTPQSSIGRRRSLPVYSHHFLA